MRLFRLSAGMVDAGASSLATFVAGIAATRLLDPVVLGAYALLFSVWLFTQQIPLQLILVPAEARLAAVGVDRRAGALRHNLVLASPFSLAAAAITMAGSMLVPAEVPEGAAFRLAATAAAVTALFPLQLHARRLLHLARRHWAAASLSLVRLLVTGSMVAIGWLTDFEPTLVPFGAILLGDALAVAVALGLTRPARSGSPSFRALPLLMEGRWLLVGMVLGPAAGMVVKLVVAYVAGSSLLGVAEAARVVAQPVLVAATGLAAVMRPSSMEAAVALDRIAARRTSRQFTLILGGVGLLYLLWIRTGTPVNLLREVVPLAFTVPGLVVVSVVAALSNGLSTLYLSELVALRRTRSVATMEGVSATARSVSSAGVVVLGAFTVPAAALAAGLCKLAVALFVLRGVYSRVGSR